MARLVEKDSGRVVAERVEIARSTIQRMRGLLGRAGLPRGHAMIIERCGSIHTFFMKFALDVIFLDSEWKVKKVSRGVVPWRLAGALGAARTVEMAAGALDDFAPQPGTALVLEEMS